MGNQKSLYKLYFNEVYLKRNDEDKHLAFNNNVRPHTGIDNSHYNPF